NQPIRIRIEFCSTGLRWWKDSSKFWHCSSISRSIWYKLNVQFIDFYSISCCISYMFRHIAARILGQFIGIYKVSN
ncbi:hypothetical protein LK518_23165, partial [Parabacteroides distasonis]|uniref:hypothetical protein n=1 Tax=Parabacteroides distasonis TaxID=823 RepID=UPI001D128765